MKTPDAQRPNIFGAVGNSALSGAGDVKVNKLKAESRKKKTSKLCKSLIGAPILSINQYKLVLLV